jgi:hypothetical protein
MKGFVTAINKYIRQEIQRRQIKEDVEILPFNKRYAVNRKSRNLIKEMAPEALYGQYLQ